MYRAKNKNKVYRKFIHEKKVEYQQISTKISKDIETIS